MQGASVVGDSISSIVAFGWWGRRWVSHGVEIEKWIVE